MKKLFQILYLTGFFSTFILNISGKAQAASHLQWQAWMLDKAIADIIIDEKGHIETSYFRDGKPIQMKYYFIDTNNNYRCAENLKGEIGADCKKACFPSYRQPGLNFSLPLQNLEACKLEKQKSGLLGEKYLEFKSESYKISCPVGEVNLTVIPEFEKYSDFINKSGNTYFKSLLQRFQIKGLVAHVTIEDKQAKQTLKLYEAKKLSLNKNTSEINLPEGYLKIPYNPYVTKMEALGLSIGQLTAKKRAALAKSEEKKELAQLEEACEMRFPAQADKASIIILCRDDLQIGAALLAAESNWQKKLDKEIIIYAEQKLKEESAKIIEGFCKK